MMAYQPSVLLLVERELHSGAWNMAFDEALLEAARETGLLAVRFYRWNEPTLSLGYFQKRLPDSFPEPLRLLPRVRRLSGGGAILHHREWTYSCVLPPEHPLALNPVRLYEVVHQQIAGLLNEQNVAATLRGETLIGNAEEPFLCFGRQDPRDIVLGPHKIVGSAQRRRRGAVLQHGSLLLERSEFAPMYSGLFDLARKDLPITESIPRLAESILRQLSDADVGQWEEIVPADILNEAERLEREKYQQINWR
jgi:lipoate-protein ligase A